jgi:hypothetical protein
MALVPDELEPVKNTKKDVPIAFKSKWLVL